MEKSIDHLTTTCLLCSGAYCSAATHSGRGHNTDTGTLLLCGVQLPQTTAGKYEKH